MPDARCSPRLSEPSAGIAHLNRRAIYGASSLALFAGPALAKQVTLTSRDGQLTIEGDLIEVTEDTYIVDSDLGTVSIRRAFVICEGPGCPAEGTFEPA